MATFNRSSLIRSNTRLLGIPRNRSDPPRASSETNKDTTAWDIYNTHRGEVERERVQDWNDMLNTLLVFAALYSAVLTAFIIESMKLIQEDTSDTTNNILLVISQQLYNTSTPPFNATAHEFIAPHWAVRVNYCFFVSLAGSLVTALASVLALQWVGSYDHGLNPSSVEGRALQRQFRTHGALHWKLDHIIAFLPTIIFISLVIFLAGLGQWLWKVHSLVAIIVISGAAFGTLFFGITTLISIFNVAAPFRTPVSRYLPLWIGFLAKPVVKIVRGVARLRTKLLAYLKKLFIRRNQGTGSTETATEITTDNAGQPLLAQIQKFSLSVWKLLERFIPFFDITRPIEDREHEAINSNKSFLVPSSLFWLAESINIEPDQRHNITVVVQAILDLRRFERLQRNVNSTAWVLIFHELHAPLSGKTQWKEHSPDEMQHAVLVMKCLTSIGSAVFSEKEFLSLVETFYALYPDFGRISNMLASWRYLELEAMEQEERDQSQSLTVTEAGTVDRVIEVLQRLAIQDIQAILGQVVDNWFIQSDAGGSHVTLLDIYQQIMQYWFILPLEFVIMALESIQEDPRPLTTEDCQVFGVIADHLTIEEDENGNKNVIPLQVLDLLQGILISQLSPPPHPLLDLKSYLDGFCAYLGLSRHEHEGDVISIETTTKQCDKEGAFRAHKAIVEQTIARLALFRDSDMSNGSRIQDILPRILQHVQSPLWKKLNKDEANMDQALLKSLSETDFNIWAKENRFDTAKIISIALNLDGDFHSDNWMAWWVEFILGLQNFIEKEEDDDGELQDITIKLGRKALEAGLLDGLSCPPDQITRLKDLTDPHVQILASVATQSTELVRSLLPSLAELGRDSEWREFIEFSYNYISGHGTIKPSFLAVFTAGCSLDMFDRMYRERIKHLPKTPSQLSRYLVAPALTTILRHAEARPDESMGILESLCQLENFVLEFSKVEGFELLPRFIRKNPLYLEEVLNIIQLAITTHPANSHSLKWLTMTHKCLLATGEAIQEDIVPALKLWKYVERNAQLLKGKLQGEFQHRNNTEIHLHESKGFVPPGAVLQLPIVEAAKIVFESDKTTPMGKEESDREGVVAELSVEEKKSWNGLLKIVLIGLEKGYLESTP